MATVLTKALAAQPPQPPAYQDPFAAQIQALQDRLAQPDRPMYTPEEVAQRQADNQQQYALGVLGQLSGDEGLAGVGGQVLKNALAARQPRVTERGVADPISGQFSYSPDYMRQQLEGRLQAAELKSGQAQEQWNNARQQAFDRYMQMLQHDQDQRETRMLIASIAGQLPGGQMDGMVDALGQYKIDPAAAFARLAPAARANLITAVQQKYPDYDPTSYAAKVKGAKDFGSGQLGTQMRNFAVAGSHLDQLTTLAQALNNGNFPLVNQIGNAFGVQSGQSPVAVFNAVRQLVGPEITGAIVMGGGSAHERDQAAATFNPNMSPAQFLATIGATRNLMQAKHDALIAQRNALGLSNNSLPNYLPHEGGNAAPGNAPPPSGQRFKVDF